MSATLAPALALRARVLLRRHGTPLEGVLLLGTCGLAWLGGDARAKRLAVSGVAHAGVVAPLVGAALVGLVVVLAALARHLLVSARELVLLVPAGVEGATLVRLRAGELAAAAALGLLPLVALAVGASGGVAGAPLALLALALLAPAAAGVSLCVGLLLARLAPGARVGLGAALLAGALGLLVLAGEGQLGVRPIASRALAVLGGWLVGPAAGDLAPLAAPVVVGLGLLALGLALGPTGLDAAVSRAAPRDPSARGRWPAALHAALRPVAGDAAAALLARDLALIARGALPRALVILAGLPVLATLVLLAARGDETLDAWLLRFAALLVAGVAACGSGFLFGVDLPRARRRGLILERTTPVHAGAVARSRALPAALHALLVVGLLSAVVATDPSAERAEEWSAVLLRGALLALLVVHDAVAHGLGSEAAADGAAAATYPLRAAPLVLALAVSLVVSPLGALVYVLLGYVGHARAQARRWTRMPVDVEAATAS